MCLWCPCGVPAVWLAQFIAYFSGLAARGEQRQVMIRVVDAVGGIERRIQQWEVAGSYGIHLGISLDAPSAAHAPHLHQHRVSSARYIQYSLLHTEKVYTVLQRE